MILCDYNRPALASSIDFIKLLLIVLRCVVLCCYGVRVRVCVCAVNGLCVCVCLSVTVCSLARPRACCLLV
jgi:hypothetical protein